MKKVSIAVFTAINLLAGVASASPACPTTMGSFRTADVTGTNTGEQLDAAIEYNQVLRRNIETLEVTQGNLQAIPINVGTQAGTSSLNMSWSSLIIGLAKKLAASPTGDQDIRYLLGGLEPKVANIVATQAMTCRFGSGNFEKDGTENVVLMITWSINYDHLADFLSKSSIYLKKGNPKITKKMTDEEIRDLPFSKMPPI